MPGVCEEIILRCAVNEASNRPTPMIDEICESNPEARRACRVCGGPIIDGCDCETMTTEKQAPRSVLQDWVQERPIMQQTVLLTAIRGPDGIAKYSSVKLLLRWYRRCVLLSAFDRRVLATPFEEGGGSFTGQSLEAPDDALGGWQHGMRLIVDEYLRAQDALPFHFQMHLMHAAEIVGYHHPASAVRMFWNETYRRLVNSMHCNPETQPELDERLSDTREGWLKRADAATAA